MPGTLGFINILVLKKFCDPELFLVILTLLISHRKEALY